MDAFAYGKPVIGSDTGGIPGQMLHGTNGYLFPPGDAHSPGERVRELHRNPDLICGMGEKARGTVETKHSEERHFNRLMEIYDRLLSKKSGATSMS